MTAAPPIPVIDIWLVKIFDQPREPARSILSGSELERSNRYHQQADRHRYEVTRASLRRLLGRTLNLAPNRIEISQDANGKPELDAPPRDLWFNCSHSGDLAMIGISTSGPLGVDIEQVVPRGDLQGLASTSLTQLEIARLDQFKGLEKWAEFYRYWTLKEALLKATGSGLRRDPRSVEVDPGRAGSNALIAATETQDSDWTARELLLENTTARAAVAFRGTASLGLRHYP